MEKKKMKIWKKVLIIIGILLLVAIALVLYRYSIITKIQQRYDETNSKPNYYFFAETENMISKVWKKDGVYKMDAIRVGGEGHLTFWKDTNTGEELVFWNTPEKLYSVSNGGIFDDLPASTLSGLDEPEIKFLIAINPIWYIGTKEYKDKECYYLKIDSTEEYIEKDTGILLHDSLNGNNTQLTYEFDVVTDKDVEKPDLSEYKLRED